MDLVKIGICKHYGLFRYRVLGLSQQALNIIALKRYEKSRLKQIPRNTGLAIDLSTEVLYNLFTVHNKLYILIY